MSDLIERPTDAADPTYPDAERCAQTLEACEDDLLTEAQFVRWQGQEIERMTEENRRLRADLLAGRNVVNAGLTIHTLTAERDELRRQLAEAEPMADSDADYWLRNRQPILDAIERAGFMLMSNASGFWLHPRGATDAQAEPKREPLSDERIDTALQTDPVLITRLMIGSMTVGEFRAALRRLARIVERALEIGGSDAE